MSEYRLPWPPTVNAMYLGRTKKVLSKEHRTFRQNVLAAICHKLGRAPTPLTDPYLMVRLMLHPPHTFGRRRWDIDNRVKPTLDALQDAGVLVDDSQVSCVVVHRMPPLETEPDGCVDVLLIAEHAPINVGGE